MENPNERLLFDIIENEKIEEKKIEIKNKEQDSMHLQDIYNSIDQVPNLIVFPRHSTPNSTLKFQIMVFLKNNNFKLWLCLILISFLSSTVAISATFASHWLLSIRMYYVQGSFLRLLLSSLAFSNLSTHLCAKFSNAAEGSGIPELKSVFSGFNYYEFLNINAFVVKYLGIILIKSAGFSIGFEAAFVHLVAIIGENITRLPCFREVSAR